jgi:serine/threonine protein phosphatase PrpC
VWLPDAWFPGLAVSRAIGDGLAQGVGVTPEPDTVALALTGLDRFIVLASDGVWEFVSCQEAVDIVARAGGCPEAGANALANASVKRWMMAAAECGGGGVVVDDVTVVVVTLRPGGGGDGAGHSAAAVKRAAAPATSSSNEDGFWNFDGFV